MTSLFSINHNPTVSPSITITTAIEIIATIPVEKVNFNFSIFPSPSAYVINLEVALPNDVEINVNILITPPTTLYTPKSSTPKVSRTILEVYKPTTIEIAMRKYSAMVFLAIRLVFSDAMSIYFASIEVFPGGRRRGRGRSGGGRGGRRRRRLRSVRRRGGRGAPGAHSLLLP